MQSATMKTLPMLVALALVDQESRTVMALDDRGRPWLGRVLMREQGKQSEHRVIRWELPPVEIAESHNSPIE